MQNREPRVIRLPRRQENRAARALGGCLVAGVIVFCVVASMLLAVAIVAGLWRFITWAMGA